MLLFTYQWGIALSIEEVIAHWTGNHWTPMFFKKNIAIENKNNVFND